ncbi:branched-chain amino acid ABC transporter permease [soil metagenome]
MTAGVIDFLQLTVAGLSAGSAYGLVAVGFVTIHSVTGIINLAQGEFAMVAAFVAIALLAAGLPLPIAGLLAVLVVALGAAVVERVAIAPAAGSSVVAYIMLTLGVSITLKASVLLIEGPQSKALPAFTGGILSFGGVLVRPQDLWILAATLVAALGLYAFLERTVTGKAFRACAEQPTAARLVGVSPARMSTLSFVLAGTVGAVAGVVSSPVIQTDWNIGLFLGLKGFVAASLGGLASIPAAIAGGLLLGVVESLGAFYVSSGLRDAIAFFVLIVVLVARPGGVFGRTQAAARV